LLRSFVYLLLGGLALAQPRYDIQAQVDVPARRVSGHTRITVPPASVERSEIFLWRYPERFATRSKKLNDYNFWWAYPRRFNPGGMETGPITVDGAAARVEVLDHPEAGPKTLLKVVPVRPIAAGVSATLDVDMSVKVPERYGPFGCVHGECTLVGGFYPMLPPEVDGRPLLDAPPARADYRLTVTPSRVSDVIVNGALYAVEKGGHLTVELTGARAAALMVARPRYRVVEAEHRGQKIRYLTDDVKGIPPKANQILPYQPTDRTWRVLEAVKESLDVLAELGQPMAPGHTLTIVEGQERMELAVPLPGMVLVSNQIFDIFPLVRFLKFHEFQLVRALYDNWIDEHIAARERPDDIGWAPDVAASFLVDLYTIRSYRREEFARQILSWAGFIPAIDRILYAPQIQFASAYFYTLDDPDPLRDSLRDFDNLRPRGKTVYSKLRDLVGEKGLDQIAKRQIAGEPIRAAAEAVRGETLDWFWKQWLGPYPYVDYRFVSVTSQKNAEGVLVTAIVEKRGPNPPIGAASGASRGASREAVPSGMPDPVEPVEVQARDKKGRRAKDKWDGQGQRHTFLLQLLAPLDVIEIDPRGRLVERLPGNNDDLRFDDRQPPRWKFIYNNFGGLVRFFPTLGVDLSLDFSLSRILDIKNSMRFLIYHTDATQIGVSASYARYFGRKITEARLSSGVSASLSAARIDPSFGQAVGRGPHPGTTIGAAVGWGYDDRLFVWEPVKALSLDASAGVVLTILDDASVLWQTTVSAGAEYTLPLADGHGLAMQVSAAITAGSLSIARQMLGAGGAGGLRGYAVDELLGRARLVTRVEYRHVFVHDLDVNLMHAIYLRGIGGAVFADAGMVTACDSYKVDSSSFAYDVGYSLRFFTDWFGVSQTTFNLDLAVPLRREQRDCFGPLPSPNSRQPIGFFVYFGPLW
jgi:hypothetical protein